MTDHGDLATALTAVTGTPVTGLRRLSAGASRETWAFAAGVRPRILRRDPPSQPDAAGMAREAACLRAAHAAGVPVPAVLAHGDGTDGVGSPYLVVEHLDGETLPRRLLRDARWETVRPRLARELGDILARIHATPVDDLADLDTVTDPLGDLRARHDAFGEPRPALELAFRRLARDRPAPVGPRLVHGDFRHGNLLIGPDGVRGVLDWELAHLGDPREDLGWLCAKPWRFGAAPPVGGLGTRADLLDGYAAVAGERPDPSALRWWEAYASANWAVMCRTLAERHVGGHEQSVEMAAIGRRAAEAEHDVLLALGIGTPEARDDPMTGAPPPPPTLLDDRPGADELLGAVVGFLRDELVTDDERTRFLARVAAGAVTVARRELRAGDAVRAEHRDRLAGLGVPDDAALAAAIRAGTLGDDAPDVVAVVRAATTARLLLANPRYLAAPDDPGW